jgi:hypothetical protein
MIHDSFPVSASLRASTRLSTTRYWRYLGVLLLGCATAALLTPHLARFSPADINRPLPASVSNRASSTTGCGHGWTLYYCPSPGPSVNGLLSVAAIAPNDVWAVGAYYDASVHIQALIEHWDGVQWSISPSPVISDSNFNAVAAVSAQDIWAFGYAGLGVNRVTLIEHWDGVSWSVIPSPNVPDHPNQLRGGAVVAPNDIWAFGAWTLVNVNQTLTEHWDGTQWSIIPSPNTGRESAPFAGAAVATNDVWALGEYWCFCGPDYTFTMHWDGSQWSIVPSPRSGFFYAATALASDDVWGVGNDLDHPSYVGTLTEHWDGNSWQQVTSPSMPDWANRLNGVRDLASGDIWAVGQYTHGSPFESEPLAMHWDGSAWSLSELPSLEGGANLVGVGGLTSTDVWAVGLTYSTPEQAIAMHWDGPPCSSPTPVPFPSPTSTLILPPSTGTPTATALTTTTPGILTSTPSTPTQTAATRTATACTIQFTDVPQGSTFYSYIRCLACRGIVSGYSTSPPCTTGTPCFLPQSNVTRGQMAKFISNSANYTDPIPPTRQTFTDVAPSSTFWLYVERAYLHLVITGYTTSPPCTTGAPCFLPTNSVTRGQTAKFVSNAANYQDNIPPTRQTFTDVPPSSTFWLYIERSYLHSVIGGYTTSPPCTTGAPCFLAGNRVTRGQTAKFIANAFFPNCQPAGP